MQFNQKNLNLYSSVIGHEEDEEDLILGYKEFIYKSDYLEKMKHFYIEDPFIKCPSQFHFMKIFKFYQRFFTKKNLIRNLLESIIESKNVPTRYIGKKSSQIFKKLLDKEK